MKNKILFSLILSFTLCGCILMRYDFEIAINNLPPGSKLISVGNYSIKYTLDNVIYKAHYGEGGNIYKTEIISQ